TTPRACAPRSRRSWASTGSGGPSPSATGTSAPRRSPTGGAPARGSAPPPAWRPTPSQAVAPPPAWTPGARARGPRASSPRASRAAGAPRVVLEGLWGSSSALALTGLLGTERAALVLVAGQAAQGRVVDDLRAFAELTGTRSRDGVAAVPSPHAALWRGGAE